MGWVRSDSTAPGPNGETNGYWNLWDGGVGVDTEDQGNWQWVGESAPAASPGSSNPTNWTTSQQLAALTSMSNEAARLSAAARAGDQTAAVKLAELEQRKYEFEQTLTRTDQNTGLDLLKLQATLRGPSNAFQNENVLHGVNAQGLSNAVDAIAGRIRMPSFQAPQAQPEPMTLDTLLRDAQAGTGTAGGTGGAGAGGTGQTAAQAIAEARRQLSALDPSWAKVTDQQIIDKVRSDPTVFSEPNNWIRAAIMGGTPANPVVTQPRTAAPDKAPVKAPTSAAAQATYVRENPGTVPITGMFGGRTAFNPDTETAAFNAPVAPERPVGGNQFSGEGWGTADNPVLRSLLDSGNYVLADPNDPNSLIIAPGVENAAGAFRAPPSEYNPNGSLKSADQYNAERAAFWAPGPNNPFVDNSAAPADSGVNNTPAPGTAQDFGSEGWWSVDDNGSWQPDQGANDQFGYDSGGWDTSGDTSNDNSGGDSGSDDENAATGGIISRPTLVGEAGPEVAMPTRQGTAIVPLTRPATGLMADLHRIARGDRVPFRVRMADGGIMDPTMDTEPEVTAGMGIYTAPAPVPDPTLQHGDNNWQAGNINPITGTGAPDQNGIYQIQSANTPDFTEARTRYAASSDPNVNYWGTQGSDADLTAFMQAHDMDSYNRALWAGTGRSAGGADSPDISEARRQLTANVDPVWASRSGEEIRQFVRNNPWAFGDAGQENLRAGILNGPPVSTDPNAYNAALPDPNKIIPSEWLRLPKSTRDFLISGYENKGFNGSDILDTISKLLPGSAAFTSPYAGTRR